MRYLINDTSRVDTRARINNSCYCRHNRASKHQKKDFIQCVGGTQDGKYKKML